MLVFPLPVTPKSNLVAVLVLKMRSRACFWAGLSGIWGFSSEEESQRKEPSSVGRSRVVFDSSAVFFLRVFSIPFGRMALATEGRGFR